MAKRVDTKRLRDAIKNALPDITKASQMRKYGELAAGMIKLRTRLGSGVAYDGADKQKLKSLKPSTVDRRSKLKEAGRLSGETSPRKSNLTQSGQLLDSVQVTNAGVATVSVGPKGGRDDGLTNQKVAEYVTDGGRPFNSLSKIETKRLHDEVKRNLREAIKRVLTNK